MFLQNKYIKGKKKRLQTKQSGNHERRQMDKNSTNWLTGGLPKQASTYLFIYLFLTQCKRRNMRVKAHNYYRYYHHYAL